MIELNINEYIKVKLTDFGKRMLEQDHIKFFTSLGILDKYPYTPPEEDSNGYSKFQLWELMRNFGKYMRNGGELPFQTVILINVDKEDKL
jgi:hypothetical protein